MDVLEALRANVGEGTSGLSILAHEWRERCGQFLEQPIQICLRSGLQVVHPSQTVREFVEMSQQYVFSGAPVVDPRSGFLVGVLSQADVARRLWNRPEDTGETLVSDLMTPFSFRLDGGEPLRQACDLMLRQRIHRVVISEAGQALGVLSILDILRGLLKVGA